ncbi:MAG: dihydrodipicolinate synthase family protein, partial [Pseudomonadota bacterium]|nr:dihydrodipicolinate synthase family protein [Pseudomonadota bacterium]
MTVDRIRGSITALITPMQADGGVDEDRYAAFMDWQITEGTQGLVPMGTTGESATLSHSEHEKAIRLCVEVTAGRVPVIAGTGSNSTEEAVSLSLAAQKAGADALLVVTPYYNKPTQAGLIAHYRAIHDATTLPIIIYNIPGRSVINMSV